jgi:RES domain-containing protein
MPTAWRVCPAKHARDGAAAFSGIGARLHGGRWNSKGVTVAYASETLSLSALEFLVHADVKQLRTLPLVACAASWPDALAVEHVDPAKLPKGWRATPPPLALANRGDLWVRQGRTAILLVPSAIVPGERNVLLNPGHPDAGRITYAAPEPFSFDPRLL